MIHRVPFGLLVPRSAKAQLMRPSSELYALSDWRVLLGWPEVFGGTWDTETLRRFLDERLALIGRLRGIRLVTAIYCIAFDRAFEQPEVQIPLIREMAQSLSPIAAHAVRALASSGRMLFNAEQLAILAGLIIRKGVTDEPNDAEGATQAFVEAALIVNELYGREQIALRDEAFAELAPLFASDDPTAKIESFLPIEIRAAAFDTEPLDGLLWRIRSFVEWSRAQDTTSRDYCDVDGALQSVFGVTYEELLTANLWLQAYYKTIRSVAHLQAQDPILNVDDIAAPFLDKRALRYVNAISTTLASLIPELSSSDRMTAAGLLGLQRHPLIEVGPKRYACPVPLFLGNALGNAMFHRLAEFFGILGRRKKFYNYFARFLQQYAEGIAVLAVDKMDVPLVREFQYRVGKRRKDSSDFILIEGRSALFFDVCNKRLNTEASLHEGSLSSMHADIEEMVIEQGRQLDGRINDFKDGAYTLHGRTAADFDELVPIAVTHQSIHGWAGTRAYIDRRLRECNYLQSGPRLEIVALSELEMLVQAFGGQLSFSALFCRRRNHPDLVARGRSLKNFVLLHGEWDGHARRRIPGFEDWLKRTVEDRLSAWGIDVAAVLEDAT